LGGTYGNVTGTMATSGSPRTATAARLAEFRRTASFPSSSRQPTAGRSAARTRPEPLRHRHRPESHDLVLLARIERLVNRMSNPEVNSIVAVELPGMPRLEIVYKPINCLKNTGATRARMTPQSSACAPRSGNFGFAVAMLCRAPHETLCITSD